MDGLLVDLTLSIAVLNLLIAAALAARRLLAGRRAGRLEAAQERLKPAVLAFIEGDVHELPPVDEPDLIALARLLRRYSRLLTGSARARIAQVAAGSGLVDRELAALSDRRSWRRATAAMMLGDLGTREQQARPLMKALSDRADDVRHSAARSLGRLGAVEAISRIARQMAIGRIPRALAAETLMTMGPSAADSLARLLHAAESSVRAAAAELLGLVGNSRHAPALAGLLRDTDPEVRVKAARALGRVGAEPAVVELREALDDPVPWVRAAVARTLGAVGDVDSIDRLVRMANDDEFDPAKAAAQALSELDPLRLEQEVEASASSGHLAEALDLLRLGA